jgi:hypothetical protein
LVGLGRNSDHPCALHADVSSNFAQLYQVHNYAKEVQEHTLVDVLPAHDCFDFR